MSRRPPFLLLPFIVMASIFGFGITLGFLLGSFWERKGMLRSSQPDDPNTSEDSSGSDPDVSE